MNSLACLLLLVASCHAFTLNSPRVSHRAVASNNNNNKLFTWTQLGASTLAPPVASPQNSTTEATAWECDEEANCVQVPACDEETCRTSLDVRIHGKWYDLSGT